MKEFCHLAGISIDNINQQWTNVESRVLQYASYEDKKNVKSLLAQYNGFNEKTPG